MELERQLTGTRRLKATVEAAVRLGERTDLDGVLESAVATLVDVFDAALVRVWRTDQAAGVLRLRAEGGPARPNTEPIPLKIDVNSRESRIAETARLGSPMIFRDPPGDLRNQDEWVARERIAWGAAFPLRSARRTLGRAGPLRPLGPARRRPGRAGSLRRRRLLGDPGCGAAGQGAGRPDGGRAPAQKLLAILATLPLGIVLAEKSGDWLSMGNPTGEAIWGREIGGSTIEEYGLNFPIETLDGRRVEVEERPLCRALRDSLPARGIYRRVLEDGRTMVLEVTAEPLPVPEGGAVGTFRDITDRARLESELAEHAARSKALLDHLPVGVAYFDDAGVCRRATARPAGPSGCLAETASWCRRRPSWPPRRGWPVPSCDVCAEALPHSRKGVAWPDLAGGTGVLYLDWRFEPLPLDAEGTAVPWP